MGRGRKSLFKDFMFKEGLKLAFHGFTLDQMADFWEVGVSTLRRWLRKYPHFRTALKRAKDEADFKVLKGLYKRACGFKFTEKTYERILIKGNGNGHPDQHQMTLIKKIKKYYPPDTAAGFGSSVESIKKQYNQCPRETPYILFGCLSKNFN